MAVQRCSIKTLIPPHTTHTTHTHTHTNTLTHSGIEIYSEYPEDKCEYHKEEWAYGGDFPVHTLGDGVVEQIKNEIEEEAEKEDCPKVSWSHSNHVHSTALEGVFMTITRLLITIFTQ